MEPTSDDEMVLMADVELLQLQLKKAGDRDPVNQNFEQLFFQSIASKPLAERIRKWKFRKNQLQRLVDNLPATSGEPAGSPAVGESKPPRRPPDDNEKKRKRRYPQDDIKGQTLPVAVDRKRKHWQEAGDTPARSRKT